VLKALSNPFVSFMAHPTNRKLLFREPTQLDLEEVFGFCVSNDVFLEVNSQPSRFDLPFEPARSFINQGGRVVVNMDAHSCQQLGFMRLGVSQARRAWCEKKHVLNTLPLKRLLKKLRRP